jgi:hypothetical protein
MSTVKALGRLRCEPPVFRFLPHPDENKGAKPLGRQFK